MKNLEIFVKWKQVASCNCFAKTPETDRHEKWCPYRKLDDAVSSFESWFKSLPDVDESLIENKKSDGWYVDKDISFAFIAYCEGLSVG